MQGFRKNFNEQAHRLISTAGIAVTYKATGAAGHDPVTHKVQLSVSSSTDLKAYRGSLSYSETKDASFVGKSMSMFLIAAVDLPVQPKVKDTLTAADGNYQVEKVLAHSAGTGVVVWRILAART